MREMRREEVRGKIINAAMKIFSRYGYSKAPVHLIAHEAGISKGLVFWYFDSKDKLIREVSIRTLPIDIINICLGKNVNGEDLLRCIACEYINKYSNQLMRQLLLHTLAIGSIYPEIRNLINTLCNDMLRKVSKKVFGDLSNESYIKTRMFFGSLLCYTMTLPKDIGKNEYINTIIANLLKTSCEENDID